jgi:hypothetical protein
MSSYYAFQVLPIVDSDMLSWAVYDDQHQLVGFGAAVTESDAHTAVKLCVRNLQAAADDLGET